MTVKRKKTNFPFCGLAVITVCIVTPTVGCSCSDEPIVLNEPVTDNPGSQLSKKEKAGKSDPKPKGLHPALIEARIQSRKKREESAERRRNFKKIELVPEPGQIIIEGGGGGVHVIGGDPHEGHSYVVAKNLEGKRKAKMAWLAMTCLLEDCPSRKEPKQPVLFPKVYPEIYVNEEGFATWGAQQSDRPSTPATKKPLSKDFVCPACGKREGVRRYEPPEVTQRREELMDELRQIRATRGNRNGEATASGEHRTPNEIMEELNALPTIYIAE